MSVLNTLKLMMKMIDLTVCSRHKVHTVYVFI